PPRGEQRKHTPPHDRCCRDDERYDHEAFSNLGPGTWNQTKDAKASRLCGGSDNFRRRGTKRCVPTPGLPSRRRNTKLNRLQLSAGAEHDRVGHRDDAVFGLRKTHTVERGDDAADDLAVGQIGAAVLYVRYRAVPADDEADPNPPLEVGVRREPLFVAHPEAPEVLTHDALNHLGRQAARDL